MSYLTILNLFNEYLKAPSNVYEYSKIQNTKQNSCCIICYEDFDHNSIIYELVCKHFYHKKCILEWSKFKDACPICREKL